jgi:DNA-binding NtrC family response regulator
MHHATATASATTTAMTARRPARVLIADDEKDIRWVLTTTLRQEGFEPIEADSGQAVLRTLRKQAVDVVLLDLRMPDQDGLDVLRALRRFDGSTPVVLLTGFGSIATAVQAMQAGATSYLTKPFDNAHLIQTLRGVVEQSAMRSPAVEPGLETIMGTSAVIRHVIETVERVGPTEHTVIVRGETGTGKEVVARGLHRHSRRASGPFVAVDCGALTSSLIESELFGHERGAFTGADRTHTGCFEAAHGGTLFLDEIGNLPLAMQAKLLRVLQERQVRRVGSATPIAVNVRVVVATNADLRQLVASGQFRADLYYRLAEYEIVLPALRHRRADIERLASRFAAEGCAELGRAPARLTAEAIAALRAYDWPGNVRELRNVIRRALVWAEDTITPHHLDLPTTSPPAATASPDPYPALACGRGSPSTNSPSPSPPDSLGSLPLPLDGQVPLRELVRRHAEQIERLLVEQALRQSGGNKAKAARLLQVDYKTIRTKAKEYQISHTKEDDRE